MRTAEKTQDSYFIRMAVQTSTVAAADHISREFVSDIGCDCGGPSFFHAGFVHGVRSYRRVEGNRNAGRFSRIRVNPVIEPTREHHEQAGSRSHSKWLSV